MLNPNKGRHTWKDIKNVPLVRPRTCGEGWTGLSHSLLVQSTLNQAASEKGLTFKLLSADLARFDHDISVGLILDPDSEKKLPKLPAPWRYGLGIVNSNTGRYRLRWTLGAWKPLPEPAKDGWPFGITWASFVASTYLSENKMNPGFDLEAEVSGALERWHAGALRLAKRITKLATTELDRGVVTDLIMKAVKDKVTPASRGMQALRITLADEPATALALLTAFGAASARNPGDLQQEQLQKFFERVREVVAPVAT